MNIKTCFDTLRVSRDATLEEAKQSYRKLVKRWHPDQFGSDPEKQQVAHEKLKEINVAYREIVALLKNSTPSAPPEPGKTAKRHPAGDRIAKKKPPFFQRMASMFKTRNGVIDDRRKETFAGSRRAAGHGPGAPPSSDFQQVLKRAVRTQPRKVGAGSVNEGRSARTRRKNEGCRSGTGSRYRMPPAARRSRGDRVEKISPVRRVGKIGD